MSETNSNVIMIIILLSMAIGLLVGVYSEWFIREYDSPSIERWRLILIYIFNVVGLWPLFLLLIIMVDWSPKLWRWFSEEV